MPLSSVLAVGTTSAVSTDIVIPAGSTVTVGIYFSASTGQGAGSAAHVNQATPGADNFLLALDALNRSTVLIGPGTFRVTRQATAGPALGVFTEV
jgi:opacity protein-like surface antigen